MKKKVEVPLLEDVVSPGRDLGKSSSLSTLLTDSQIQSLQQQIDEIVKKRLEIALNKASQEVLKGLKSHLDKVLPDLIKTAQETAKRK